jgi:nitrogen-specific signal transduction histidine kinase
VVNEDVTERVRLEEQVRQAQKMEAVGRLAGGVAHDFNNLIAAIRAYIELMPEGGLLSASQHQYLSQIGEAADRAVRLTDQLLAFSRKAVVAPEVLDLNGVVESMALMLRRLIGEDVALITLLGPGVIRVRLDPGQLDQVIMNLAVNARDAMPGGGRLTIETRQVLVGPGAAGAAGVQPGEYVELAIADTGHGMTPEVKARVFEPFFTTKEPGKGTGLGLATVFGIVKQAGGHVSAESQPGAGTRFTVLLPAAEARAVAPSAPDASSPAAPEGPATVLLVEDNDLVRTSTRLLLMRQGYDVIEAASGADALSAAERELRPIHLLLTDVVMPDLGGRDLADEVRQRRPGVKVLYMSGYTDDAVLRHGVSRASDPFLQKPFTLTALARIVRQVLEN